MTYNIFACEQNFLYKYLSDINNEPNENIRSALDMVDILKESPSIYRVNGDTAEIDIKGVLLNGKLPLFARMLGYQSTSYGDIIASVNAAIKDDSVNTVKLIIDTPGGDVHGVDEVRTIVEAACKKKRVMAINTGMIASAGYWIASAADEIISTSPVNETGSIGVVITQYIRDDGQNRVKILSRNAENKQPDATTSKGITILQDKADAIERVFLQRVADGRNTSVKNVIDKFGKGDLYIAYDPDPDKLDALSVGMIDSVTDLSGGIQIKKTGVVKMTEKTKENQILNISEATSKYPELKKELDSMLKEAFEKGAASASEVVKELQDRYVAVASYLKSDAYPDSVKNLAYNLLEGKISSDMFQGAIIMYDATLASQKIENAISDTKDVGSTYSKAELKKDPDIVTDADEDEIVAKLGGK